MTQIYIAPFHTNPLNSDITPKAIEENWPYDNGDDPSFQVARKFGGKLTWGVCRPDVRNSLYEGDIVVFFSYSRHNAHIDSNYRMCGLATVERKVSQTDIWQDPDLSYLQSHQNLLVRPSNDEENVWEHYEPALPGSKAHKTWLWRCTNRSQNKHEFKRIQKTDKFKIGTAINGIPVYFVPNYILFSSYPTKTWILSNPPVVAKYKSGNKYEEWNEDSFSKGIRELTLGKAANIRGVERNLRTENKYLSHRHIKFDLPVSQAENWRKSLIQFIENR